MTYAGIWVAELERAPAANSHGEEGLQLYLNFYVN
jgi:hypothetical protein